VAGYLFEYASAAKSPAGLSRLLLHLLVRFSVSKQLFASSKTMADAPTDIDGVFAFKRQNVAKERFYSVVHSPPPFAPAGAPAWRRPFCHYFTDRLRRVEVNTVFSLFPEHPGETAQARKCDGIAFRARLEHITVRCGDLITASAIAPAASRYST
jgi:hypothetical protein